MYNNYFGVFQHEIVIKQIEIIILQGDVGPVGEVGPIGPRVSVTYNNAFEAKNNIVA